MSRGPKKSASFDYFILNKEKTFFICQVPKGEELCQAKISATSKGPNIKPGTNAPSRTYNLKRHLSSKHPEIYKVVEEQDELEKRPGLSTRSTSQAITMNNQYSMLNYVKKNYVKIEMDAENFKKYLIGLVVENGVALSFFSTPSFRGLNGEMAIQLGISLDRHDIRKMVLKEAEKQKDLLKKNLHNKFFYLKMDACTRQRTNYMAINLQFIDDENNIAIRTMAIKDTESQHSSDYIKSLIEKVLKDYNLSKEQILSIVTDNASNMVKTVEKLNDNEEDLELEENCILINFDEDEDNTHDSEHNFDQNVDTAVNDFVGYSNIPHMRCAVHTLQLAIRDGLKEKEISNVISRLRNVAVAARTPKLDAVLKRRAGKGALIDQATRWGSTFIMVKRLVELKEFLVDTANTNVSLTEHQWNEAADLMKLLEIPYSATLKLQAAKLTGGTFYKEWKAVCFKLGMIGGMLADSIKKSMQRREEQLLNNNVLLASIYVDPMNRILLTADQRRKAKDTLCDIAVKNKLFLEKQIDCIQATSISETESCNSSSPSRTSDNELDFDKYLDNEEKTAKRFCHDRTVSTSSSSLNPTLLFRQEFMNELEKIERIDRKSKLDVMKAIENYPVMVQLAARTVSALPPTQVSVERLFSALRLIKTHLRSLLKEDITEAILFLRTNSVN